MTKENQKKDKKQTKENKRDYKITAKNVDKFTVVEDKLIHIETGEIIDNVYTIYEYIHTCQKTERESDISKDFYYNDWLSRNKFTKLYQVNSRELHDTLSLQAKGLLFIFMCHLNKSTNEVMIEGKRPTNKMLLDNTKINIKTLNKLFVELEQQNVIKRIGSTHKRIILLNPYVFFNGKNLVKTTLQSFYPEHE